MDKAALRRALIEERLNLPDRLQRGDLLQQVMRIWLVNRPDTVIGAYWPIKGEFDPLPALHRWKEDGELLDGPNGAALACRWLTSAQDLTFHVAPRLPHGKDAYGIPKQRPEVIVTTCCCNLRATRRLPGLCAAYDAPWPRCRQAGYVCLGFRIKWRT